jgi:hypothetical protein
MFSFKLLLKYRSLLLLLGLMITACEKDAEFDFDLDDLIGVSWGIPQIIELGPAGDFDLTAPTIFYSDNTVSIGTARYDIWSIRSSRTILLEQSQELWFVIALDETQLRVEKNRYPGGEFIMRCVYHPME